jgi:hypothetical protein
LCWGGDGESTGFESADGCWAAGDGEEDAEGGACADGAACDSVAGDAIGAAVDDELEDWRVGEEGESEMAAESGIGG